MSPFGASCDHWGTGSILSIALGRCEGKQRLQLTRQTDTSDGPARSATESTNIADPAGSIRAEGEVAL